MSPPFAWGKYVWRLLHGWMDQLDRRLGGDKTAGQWPLAKILRFLKMFGHLLPCPACSQHFAMELGEKFDLEKSKTPATGGSYFLWTVDLRNRIATRVAGKQRSVDDCRPAYDETYFKEAWHGLQILSFSCPIAPTKEWQTEIDWFFRTMPEIFPGQGSVDAWLSVIDAQNKTPPTTGDLLAWCATRDKFMETVYRLRTDVQVEPKLPALPTLAKLKEEWDQEVTFAIVEFHRIHGIPIPVAGAPPGVQVVIPRSAIIQGPPDPRLPSQQQPIPPIAAPNTSPPAAAINTSPPAAAPAPPAAASNLPAHEIKDPHFVVVVEKKVPEAAIMKDTVPTKPPERRLLPARPPKPAATAPAATHVKAQTAPQKSSVAGAKAPAPKAAAQKGSAAGVKAASGAPAAKAAKAASVSSSSSTPTAPSSSSSSSTPPPPPSSSSSSSTPPCPSPSSSSSTPPCPSSSSSRSTPPCPSPSSSSSTKCPSSSSSSSPACPSSSSTKCPSTPSCSDKCNPCKPKSASTTKWSFVAFWSGIVLLLLLFILLAYIWWLRRSPAPSPPEPVLFEPTTATATATTTTASVVVQAGETSAASAPMTTTTKTLTVPSPEQLFQPEAIVIQPTTAGPSPTAVVIQPTTAGPSPTAKPLPLGGIPIVAEAEVGAPIVPEIRNLISIAPGSKYLPPEDLGEVRVTSVPYNASQLPLTAAMLADRGGGRARWRPQPPPPIPPHMPRADPAPGHHQLFAPGPQQLF